MPTIEELRAAMAAAPLTGKGTYLPAGTHKVRIEKFFFKDPGQNSPLGLLIAEFKAIESTSPEVQIETMTYSETFDPTKSGWEDRLQKFLFSALGCDFRGARPAWAQKMVADIRFANQLSLPGAAQERARLIQEYGGHAPEAYLIGRVVAAQGEPYTTKKKVEITSIQWRAAMPPLVNG